MDGHRDLYRVWPSLEMQEGATEVGVGRQLRLKVRATGTGLLIMLTLLAVDTAACVSLVCS